MERTSPKIASLAGKVLADPSSTPEARSLAASALTQAPDRTQTGRDLYILYRSENNRLGADPLPEWCELDDEEQATWNSKV